VMAKLLTSATDIDVAYFGDRDDGVRDARINGVHNFFSTIDNELD